MVLSALTFAAVETGIESGAGIWGYVFLTAGRGLSHETAGVIIAHAAGLRAPYIVAGIICGLALLAAIPLLLAAGRGTLPAQPPTG